MTRSISRTLYMTYILIGLMTSSCLRRGDELSSVTQINRISDAFDRESTEVLELDQSTTN